MQKAGRATSKQPPLQAVPALNLLPAVTLGSNTAAVPPRLPVYHSLHRSRSATAALNALPLPSQQPPAVTTARLTIQSEPLDCCCMCDCENMTTSVRDEKIALVFETVFEEQASDEGEVAS